MIIRFRHLSSAALAAAVCLSPMAANAQDSGFLEEIVVTAQKREQNLQDIPVAVTAYSGAQLQDSGVFDMRDLAAIAPSLISSQSQTATNSSFSIRGIGTSSQNFGLEASVGVYVDGVYVSRPSAAINELVDIESVEVLRGPQGTLFGKNTPSGALNIKSKRPGSGGSFIEATVGDFDLVSLRGAADIVISEDVAAFRASIFSMRRDGFVDVVGFGEDVMNDRDRLGGRFQFLYTPNDRLEARIIADYSEIDERCCAALTQFNNFAGFGGANGSDAFIAFGLGLPVITGAQFDDRIMALNVLPRSTNEDSGISLQVDYEFDNVTLTSISAFRAFDTTDFIDADFSAADIVTDTNIAAQQSFSQELRFAGSIGERVQYVAGLYYFEQDLDNASTLNLGIHTDAFFGLDPNLTAIRAAVDGFSAATGGAFPVSAAAFPADAFVTDDMKQDHESTALFAQMDFEVSDSFVITAGLRFTDEKKVLDYNFINSPIGPQPDLFPGDAANGIPPGAVISTLGALQMGLLNPADPADAAVILGALGPTYVPGWGLYSLATLAPQASGTEIIDDDQITGTIKGTWFMNDETMFYASYGTGYKSGGTNTDRIDPVFPQFFGAETSTAIEIGMKADFPNQNLRLNVAIHDTEVEDLQVNAFTGTGFNLQNAGIGDTNGIEIEALWVPSDTFELQFSYAYTVADLKDFPLGTCWVATPFQTGVADPGQGAAGLPVCDRSGGRVASNAEQNFYIAARKDFRISNNTSAFVRAEGTHTGDTMTDGNNDPLKLRPGFERFNLRVGLVFEQMNAELSLWGRNITDEQFYETVFDVPLQDGKLNAYPHDPRTWGITFRKDFD